MKRRWKLLAVLLGLPLSWMALVASGWLPRLRAEDVAAVTMLSQPAALTGSAMPLPCCRVLTGMCRRATGSAWPPSRWPK